jgi:hypothetical protein
VSGGGEILLEFRRHLVEKSTLFNVILNLPTGRQA